MVKQLRSGVENLVGGHGAEIIRGEGVLTGLHTIQVGEELVEADQIILAAGSVPASIPVPGADLPGVMNSDGVLSLEECPDSVVIIGGGVIGVEFATLFNSLGKQVTIIEMLPSILHGNDPDICRSMTELLTDRGVKIYTGAKLLSIQEGLVCTFEQNGETLTAEGAAVIMAAGRKPDSKALGLEAVGVQMDRGFVQVDDEMRTNVPHIYAIGDLTGKQQLAHVATAQGLIAAHNAAGEHRSMRYRPLSRGGPRCWRYSFQSLPLAGVRVDTFSPRPSYSARSLSVASRPGPSLSRHSTTWFRWGWSFR